MTYISGTLTDSNAPATLYGACATALGSAGYTLVDTVVIATKTHKVWKSPAGSNLAALDWYLDVAYTTTGAGSLWMTPFEFFDPATDLGYRGPYSAASASVDAASGTRYGAAGSALETNWSPSAVLANAGLVCPATSFAYWISITTNRVMMMGSINPTYIHYTGLYEPDPLWAARATNLFPLWTGRLADGYLSVNTEKALIRVSPFTAISAWSAMGNPTGAVQVSEAPAIPGGITTGSPFVATRIQITGAAAPVPVPRFGYLYGVGVLPTVGVVRGDTVTIGSDTWICTTTGTQFSGIMQAI